MNTITKHKDRPEFKTEEQQELEEEAHRKLRNYTKRVLKHTYLKARKKVSDDISHLINDWKFDVPGWNPVTVCPVFHKTQEDLEFEQEMEDKKNYFLGCQDGLKKTKIQIENEALRAKYDEMPSPEPTPKKSSEENIKSNAKQIINQFRGKEFCNLMLEAFEKDDYNKVFELAFQYDMRRRYSQRFETPVDAKQKELDDMTSEEADTMMNWQRRARMDLFEMFDEIIEHSKPDPSSQNAPEHCMAALKHLSGDLTYDDRAEAKKALLQSVKSLEAYPQTGIPESKKTSNECTCPNCSNTRDLNVLLNGMLTESSRMSEEEKQEVDNLFDCGLETPSDTVTEERLIEFGDSVVF